MDAELAVDNTDVVCRVGDNPRLERDCPGKETDEQRDYQAEIVELFSDGKWRTPKEIAAPRKDDGIGANVDTVKKLLRDVTRLVGARSTSLSAVDPARFDRLVQRVNTRR